MAKAQRRAAKNVWAERAAPPPTQTEPPRAEFRLPGMLGGSLFTNMMDGRGIFGYINIGVAVLLIYIAVWGMLTTQSSILLPFGLGLLGVRFLLAYIENNLRVNLGKIATPLHYAILLSALVCVLLGMANIGG